MSVRDYINLAAGRCSDGENKLENYVIPTTDMLFPRPHTSKMVKSKVKAFID